MKVLHVITGLNDGGAEAAMTRLIAATPQHRHIVVSLTGEGKYRDRLSELSASTHLLDARGPAKLAISIARISGLVRREKPDVVQCWMYHADFIGGLAARIAGTKSVVWNLRSQFSEDWRWPLRTIFALNARMSRIIPARIIASSEQARRSHVVRGYYGARIAVVPNGLDLNRFQPDPIARKKIRKTLGIHDDEFLLGRVGRVAAQKDFPTLFSALAALRKMGLPLRMLLVGRGTETGAGELDGLIGKYGVQDQLIRLGARTDVEALMNAMDLHVSSSTIEGFPNVISEAMACGVPCVTTPAGAAAEIVGPWGWVIPTASPIDLAEAIRAARSERDGSPATWERRRSGGVEHVALRYTMGAMAKAYDIIWKASASHC